jgi:hypothetical protein
VGRLHDGILYNCASSRYQTISQLLWVVDIVLLLMVATPRQGEPNRRDWSARRRMAAVLALVVLGLLVLPLMRREVVWAGEIRRQGEQRTFLRGLLLSPTEFLLHPPPQLAQAVHRACSPREAAELAAKRAILIRHRLSLYRHSLPDGAPPRPPSPTSGL